MLSIPVWLVSCKNNSYHASSLYPSVLQNVTEPTLGGSTPGGVSPFSAGITVPIMYPPSSSSGPIHQVTPPGFCDQSTSAFGSPIEMFCSLVVSGNVVPV